MIIMGVGAVVLGQGRGRMEALQSAFHNTSQQPGHISMAFYQWLWSFDGWNSLSQVTEVEVEVVEKLQQGSHLLCIS